MYEGHFKDGVAHGHGLQKQGHFMASVASVYIGEWVNGVKQGYGVMDDIVTGMFVLKDSIYLICPCLYCRWFTSYSCSCCVQSVFQIRMQKKNTFLCGCETWFL
jgi:hypothetical protein